MKKGRKYGISILILVFVGIWSLAPLLWILITSLKPPGTEYRIPIEYWPTNPTLENYETVLGPRFVLQRALLNSILVSSVSMILTLVFSSMAAYAIARLRFRYRIQSLLILQISGMVPPIAVIGPTFVLLRNLGLLQTYTSMILPNMVYGIPLATFLIASYFNNVPFELEDAAKIDGAGTLTTLFRIILPVALPGIFSAGILVFLGSWGEFMLANTVSLGATGVQTIPVAIASLSRAFNLQWSWVAAGIMISLFPIITGVLVLQKFIVEGLSSGSVR